MCDKADTTHIIGSQCNYMVFSGYNFRRVSCKCVAFDTDIAVFYNAVKVCGFFIYDCRGFLRYLLGKCGNLFPCFGIFGMFSC